MSKDDKKPVIVAEISKNWPNADARPLSALFERVINTNLELGYRLDSWRLDRQFTGGGMNETIIAVFVVAEANEETRP